MDFLSYNLRIFLVSAGIVIMFSGTSLASQSEDVASLRSDACLALDNAVTAVAEASRRGALWIPAQTALERARSAYERGDHQRAILHAQKAQRFAELGIIQLGSKPYQHKYPVLDALGWRF